MNIINKNGVKANEQEKRICILAMIIYIVGIFSCIVVRIINYRTYILPCIILVITTIAFINILFRIKGNYNVVKNRVIIVYSGILYNLYLFGCAFESKLYIKGAQDVKDNPLIFFAFIVMALFIVFEILVFINDKESDRLKTYIMTLFLIVYYLGMVNMASFWIIMLAIPILVVYAQFEDVRLVTVFSIIVNIFAIFGALRQIYYFETGNTSVFVVDIGGIVKCLMNIPSNKEDIHRRCVYIAIVAFMILISCTLVGVTMLLRRYNQQRINMLEEEQVRLEQLTQKALQIGADIKEQATNTDNYVTELNKALSDSKKLISEIHNDNEKNVKNIEEQTSMTHNISKLINDVVLDVQDATKITDSSIITLEKSKKSFENLKIQSNDIYKNNRNIILLMEEFVENVKDIKEITDGIANISDETNLLSLNASIESVRAKGAGKGFAVVAGEIRKLADETSKMTDYIDEIVNDLEQSAQTTQDVIENVVEALKDEDSAITETISEFDQMDDSIKGLCDSVYNITMGVYNVDTSKSEIENHISHIMSSSESVTSYTSDAEILNDKNMEKIQNTKEIMKQMLLLADELDKYTYAE